MLDWAEAPLSYLLHSFNLQLKVEWAFMSSFSKLVSYCINDNLLWEHNK